MKDQWGAFCDSELRAEATGEGLLSGLSFAVKDVFEIEGHVSGAGNPDWKRTHQAATRHAAAVELLLSGGARLVGTTHTDELMFSLNGENHHYGTPVNPKAKQRIPGGSSSGSAVAVAAGLVDFALGTDTGGSVRIPASYCGICGIRPTHGAVPMRGVIPLAPSFDTVGWFAAGTEVLLKVGKVLLPRDDEGGKRPFRRIWIGEDGFGILEPGVRQEAMAAVRRILSAAALPAESVKVAEEGLEEWMRVFRILQGSEIWNTHKDWIRAVNPSFGPEIAERFRWSSTLENRDTSPEEKTREAIRSRLIGLLGDDGLLIMPTAAGAAPLRNTKGTELEERRKRTLMLCCAAGLAGLPQVTLPWASADGLPLGVSLIAGPRQDLRLLQFAHRLSMVIGKFNPIGKETVR